MAKSDDPFRWFDSSPEVIRLVVMMYVRYPLSLHNVEDLLFERGIDICHETVRLSEIYKQRRAAALAEWRSVLA
jgi:putative transposase